MTLSITLDLLSNRYDHRQTPAVHGQINSIRESSFTVNSLFLEIRSKYVSYEIQEQNYLTFPISVNKFSIHEFLI